MEKYIFQVGFLTVNVWTCFVALGFLIGIVLLAESARRENISMNHVWNIAIIAIVCGIVGSRFLYVLENFSEFSGNTLLVLNLFYKTGLSFFGGFILSIIGIVIYVKKYTRDKNIWRIFDLLAVPILAGMTIGRAGCFLANDHPGKIIKGIQYNPALCLMLTNFVLLLIFLYLRDKIRQEGILTAFALIAIGLSRFGWDFIRVEQRYWGLTVEQMIAVCVVMAGIIFIKLYNHET